MKLNRYIFIINEVYDNGVTDTLSLRKNLTEFEGNLGIGNLDRKTLERMIETLRLAEVIKVLRKEFDIEYF